MTCSTFGEVSGNLSDRASARMSSNRTVGAAALSHASLLSRQPGLSAVTSPLFRNRTITSQAPRATWWRSPPRR